MKKRGIILGVVCLVVFIGIVGGIYFVLRGTDKNNLTITEKQWIENNKNLLQDFSIVDNVPIFSNAGTGVVFDFLTSLEENTGLDFNELSYSYGGNPTSDYAFKIVSKKEKNDILIYRDNFVLVTKEKISYNTTADIKNIRVGVLNNHLEEVEKYLNGSTNVAYTTVENENDLLSFPEVDAIVLPKTIYMEQLAGDDKLNIAYSITEMTEDYVLHLGDDETLNSILTKYYKKWYEENFDTSFKENFSEDYFEFSDVAEKDKATFHSKRYAYGFVDNLPFDTIVNKKFIGINTSFLKAFAQAAGIEISFEEYDNIDALVKALNEKKIDFFFDNGKTAKYDVDTYTTTSHVNEQVVVLSSNENNVTVNTLASLSGKKVRVVKSSLISEVLTKNGAKVEESETIEDLIKEKEKDDILVIDLENYTYYQSKLKGFKMDYQFTLDEPYKFIANDSKANKVFNRFFDFYLSYTNQTEIINDAHAELDKVLSTPSLAKIIVLTISALIVLFFSIFGIYQLTKKEKKQKTIVVKGDKIKYIDMLTSLKNRNYLNDHMEAWDGSEVYPQTIVIVDLNNINYINDNYGHQAGDEVIKQAASILIKTQMDNSEIIRTNGNEFLIYLVGYTEKQIITYIRKLHREFKELEHGFGVASGYSMIMNAIKTIDDAINEATSDMKSNKEELKGQD